MSLTRVSLCCVVLLAWASYAPVQSQEPAPNPGTASLGDSEPEQALVPEPPPAPEQNYYVPPPGGPSYGPPPGPTGYVPLDPFGVRFSFRSDIGDGPGWTDGFQSLNGFVPITFEPDRSLLFLNGRAIATNNGSFAANVGAGLRFYSPEVDRVFGGSFWYDYDDSNFTNYDQWGISLESLGKYFDMRFNAYIPSNDNPSTIGTRLNGNISFVGNNIGIGTNRTVENALRGGDFEIGGAMPFFGDYGFRSYVGAYYFQAPSVESTVGFKYRSEILVTQDIQLQIGASSDQLFGQNVYGAVTYYFPDGRPKRIMSRQPVRERLYTQVERNNRLNVYRREVNETLRAINPNTGVAYVVNHVDNINPQGTGDGSVKNPFGSLSDGSSGNADIVFVHHNQTTDGTPTGTPILSGYDTGITLLDNQRLLGQGTEHTFVDLRFGTLTLPGNDGGPLPVITNPLGDVVTLANNNEVSGFQIGAASPDGPAGNGIFGDGITDFNINRNTFLNAGLAGISINGAGTGSITENTISASGLANIDISNSTGTALTLDVSNNIAQTGTTGLILRGDGAGSDIDATVTSNTFSNNSENGIELSSVNGSVTTVIASSNVANNNVANGIQATADNGTLNLGLFDSTADLNGGDGLNLVSLNGGILNVEASDNSFSNNLSNGMFANADGGMIDFFNFAFTTMNANTLLGTVLNADDGGVINGVYASNSAENNLAGGLSSTLDNGSQLNMAFSQSQFNGNTGFGISLSAANGSSFGTLVDPITFQDIEVNDNVGPGIVLSGTTGSTIGFAMSDSTISNTLADVTVPLPQEIGLVSNISDGQASITLLNNLFDYNQDAGVSLTYSGTTTATQVIDTNTIQNTADIASTATPGGDGLIVALAGTATLDSTIIDNFIQNNVGDGILMNFNSGNATVTANEVINNNILTNGGDGLSVQVNFGTQAVLNADHNTITTQGLVDGVIVNGVITNDVVVNGANGINLDLNADSLLVANLTKNEIDGSSVTNGTTDADFSTGSGILMNIRQDATLMATLTANTIRQNGIDGVHVGPDPLQGTPGNTDASQETSHIFVTLNDNLIEQNRDDGVQVSTNQVSEGNAGFTGDAVYVLTGNTIQNNGNATTGTGNGINAEVRSGQMDLTITNNSISGNQGDGILLTNSLGYAYDASVNLFQFVNSNPHSILNATIDSNSITDNDHRGIHILFEDTTLTGNPARDGFGGRGNITMTNNLIDSNGDEGVLVVMNAEHDDNTNPNGWPFIDVPENVFAGDFAQFSYNLAELNFTAVGNTITNNGGRNPADAQGAVAGDGMFILVGTGSYVRADVRDNTFAGNFNDDFRTDSFIAGPDTPPTEYNTPDDTTTRIYLDRAARLDLRFTGNTGNSIGSVTAASGTNRIVNGQLKQGRFPGDTQAPDEDPVDPVQQKPFGSFGRFVADFRVEDTPTPVGSVLNGTNFFTDPDSQFPRDNFLNSVQVPYTIAPIGSLFP